MFHCAHLGVSIYLVQKGQVVPNLPETNQMLLGEQAATSTCFEATGVFLLHILPVLCFEWRMTWEPKGLSGGFAERQNDFRRAGGSIVLQKDSLSDFRHASGYCKKETQ